MKLKKLEETNYWPGYVDALVNVVLNMLFMVGTMAVGLVCLNVDALGSQKAVRKLQALYQANDENMMLAALGTLMASLPVEPEAATIPPSPMPLAPEPALLNPVLEHAPAAAPLVPRQVRVGATLAARSASDELAYLQARAALSTSSDVKVLEFEPMVFELSAAQQSQLRQGLAQAPAGRWLVAVAMDADERNARPAYWRVTSVRNYLISAGVPPDRIVLRVQPNAGSEFAYSRRVFLTPISN